MVSSRPDGAFAIVAENSSKLFLDGTVVAFHQLQLAVRNQEILCIVGPSGCGKTTLLRCIAGLTDISDGKLLVNGSPVDQPARGRGHGVSAFRPAAVEDGLRQRRLRPGDGRRTGGAYQGTRRALSRSGRPERLREALSLSALRRHAAARRAGARARDQSVDPADGRALRRARRADARNPAGRTAAPDGAAGRAQDHGVHHPFDRRGDPARRPRRGDDGAARAASRK